ncbi:MAG: amidohydrolase, partial [Acetobacteraceae bacterium]|nr:amidohydrolase [Acetobacteraceae bacterium]
CDMIVPLDTKGAVMVGSSDVGDVSWKVPTIEARGAVYAIGTPGHSWQLTAQGKLPAAHKGLVHVAKVMAGTAVAALTDATLIARAKDDHRKRTGGKPYQSPLPEGTQPPLDMSLTVAAE